MTKLTIASTLAVGLLTTGLSLHAIADSDERRANAEAQQTAAISLIEATTLAEQATGGRSTEAEFELEDGIAIYEIEVNLPDGSEVELIIDAQSGEILEQATDNDEQDDDKEQKG